MPSNNGNHAANGTSTEIQVIRKQKPRMNKGDRIEAGDKVGKGHITAATRDRHCQAAAMRRAGHTYQSIADALGYADPTGAREAVRAALTLTLRESGTDELRKTEMDRLDALQLSRWDAAINGDNEAFALLLRTMKQRADLMGLNAPVKFQHQGDPNNPVVVKVLKGVSMDDL
jgi:hypothetical protein